MQPYESSTVQREGWALKKTGKKLRLGKETLGLLGDVNAWVYGGVTAGCGGTGATCPCTLQCSDTRTPSCVQSGCTNEN